MTLRGVWKIHNAVQTDQAWKDWRRYAEAYIKMGFGDLVKQLEPPIGSGWRTIDRRIVKLRKLKSQLEA